MITRRVIAAEWIDSNAPASGADRWHMLHNLPHKPTRCVTVGIILHDDEDSITLAGSVSTEQWSDGDVCIAGIVTIPKFAIGTIHDLGEVAFEEVK